MQQALIPNGSHSKVPDMALNFSDYLEKARAEIVAGRIDLTPENQSTILEANSPFEWRPPAISNSQPTHGVLLIHGLYDSPFSMRDIGQFFLTQGFLVRSILLPGHGTIPGDLLSVDHHDWLKTVEYGIRQTAPLVDNFYMVGFSLGAALSLIQSDIAPNCRGLFLMALGLKPKHPFAAITGFHGIFSWMSDKLKWYVKSEQSSYVKYQSHAFHSAHQAIVTMKKAAKIQCKLPLFVVLTEDDETISPQETVEYFQQQTAANSRMIYYSAQQHAMSDQRIHWRTSSYPDKHIINFSHCCIPISPENTYLGEKGELTHKLSLSDNSIYGAVTLHNMAQPDQKLIRLTYNPDFQGMLKEMTEFLHQYSTQS